MSHGRGILKDCLVLDMLGRGALHKMDHGIMLENTSTSAELLFILAL